MSWLTINFVRPYLNLLTLHIQYIKNQTVKKCLPFELICAAYLEYIVIINFVRPYTNILTLFIQAPRNKPSKSGCHLTFYVQYTKNQSVKKWLSAELICAVYLEYIVIINFVWPYQNLLSLSVVTNKQAIKKWLPFERLCAVNLKDIVTINFVWPYQDLLTL